MSLLTLHKGRVSRKRFAMLFYEVRRTIAAPPEKIWSILSDAKRLQDGFSILRLEGEIHVGSKIKLWLEADPARGFSIKVTEMTVPAQMVWQSGMPFGLFIGKRVFTLQPLTGGQSEFTMREDYTGPLAPMIFRKIPDLAPSFRKFADGLQKATET
jgi:hypothetical protein